MKIINPLLESIATLAAEDLKALLAEANDDLLNSIHKMQTEAQAQETNPKFNIGFKISLDFDKHTFDCDLSWTVKQSLSTSHAIDDPAQAKLPGVEDMPGTVTLKTGDKEVTMTHEQFSRAAKIISGKKTN